MFCKLKFTIVKAVDALGRIESKCMGDSLSLGGLPQTENRICFSLKSRDIVVASVLLIILSRVCTWKLWIS